MLRQPQTCLNYGANHHSFQINSCQIRQNRLWECIFFRITSILFFKQSASPKPGLLHELFADFWLSPHKTAPQLLGSTEVFRNYQNSPEVYLLA
jgi:hypothetical protein